MLITILDLYTAKTIVFFNNILGYLSYKCIEC